MDVTAQWVKRKGGLWCRLSSVDPMHVALDGVRGVYVIWQADPPHRAVRVGQGSIRERLTADRDDADIQRHAGPSGLLVTWARVADANLDGVERFLADAYVPLVGGAVREVAPIKVTPLP
jgi:hypothetical protein